MHSALTQAPSLPILQETRPGKSQSHSGKFENLLSQRDGYSTLTLLLTLTPALTGANQGTVLLLVKTRSLALYLCLDLGSSDPIPIPCRRALTQAPL